MVKQSAPVARREPAAKNRAGPLICMSWAGRGAVVVSASRCPRRDETRLVCEIPELVEQSCDLIEKVRDAGSPVGLVAHLD
jgi:hypothetical protein